MKTYIASVMGLGLFIASAAGPGSLASECRDLPIGSPAGDIPQMQLESNIAAECFVGFGPKLQLNGLAASHTGDLIVSDHDRLALVRIDRVSGNRRIVTGSGVGAGPPLEGLADLGSTRSDLVTVLASKQLFQVDLMTGERILMGTLSLAEYSDHDLYWSAIESINDSEVIVAGGRYSGRLGLYPVYSPILLNFDFGSGDYEILYDYDQDCGEVFPGEPGQCSWTPSAEVAFGPGGALFLVFDGVLKQIDANGGGAKVIPGLDENDVTKVAVAEGESLLAVFDGRTLGWVDPQSGSISIVSDDSTGSGPRLDSIKDVVVFDDSIVAASEIALLDVDPDTGHRTVLSGDSDNERQTPLVDVSGAFVVETNAGLVAVGSGGQQILLTDPDSEEQSVIASAGDGQGPDFIGVCPTSACWSCGDRSQSVFSGPNSAANDALVRSDGMVLVTDSCPAWTQYLVDPLCCQIWGFGCCYGIDQPAQHSIKILDPGTGMRKSLYESQGALGSRAWSGLALHPDGRLLVRQGNKIVVVDTVTATVQVLSGPHVGSGPYLSDSDGKILMAKSEELIAVDTPRARIMKIDLFSGNRSVLADENHGFGPVLERPVGIAEFGNGSLILTDRASRTIYSLDSYSGKRVVLSSDSRGRGEPLVSPTAITIEEDGSIVVIDSGRLIRVDAFTGDRTPIDRSDPDDDGLQDSCDNCVALNNPRQIDSDGDNIGNMCDTDIDNDCFTADDDLKLLRQSFLADPTTLHWNSSADFNADGAVNSSDLAILREFYFLAPGPSGIPNQCSNR